MKAKHLSLAMAALAAAGGLWFAWSAWRSDQYVFRKSSAVARSKTRHAPNFDPNSGSTLPRPSRTGPVHGTNDRPKPGQMLNSPARLAPPIPNRRFTDFTPEERVEFARKGHGPGG